MPTASPDLTCTDLADRYSAGVRRIAVLRAVYALIRSEVSA